MWNINSGKNTEHWHCNTVQTNCKIMKYSKMQMHGNVCVHQMSVIFILKIKDYFSSNKADVTNYICLFLHAAYWTMGSIKCSKNYYTLLYYPQGKTLTDNSAFTVLLANQVTWHYSAEMFKKMLLCVAGWFWELYNIV